MPNSRSYEFKTDDLRQTFNCPKLPGPRRRQGYVYVWGSITLKLGMILCFCHALWFPLRFEVRKNTQHPCDWRDAQYSVTVRYTEDEELKRWTSKRFIAEGLHDYMSDAQDMPLIEGAFDAAHEFVHRELGLLCLRSAVS